MSSEKEKLMIDGNSFYELDMECIRKKAAKERCDNKDVFQGEANKERSSKEGYRSKRKPGK